jgi:hypothetical protein
MNVEELKKELFSARKSINKAIKALDNGLVPSESLKYPKEDVNKEWMMSIISKWNTELKAKCTLNETVKGQLRARLRSYNKDQIFQAVKNRLALVKASKWHNEPANRSHQVNISLVLRNDQELSKHLESYSQQEMFEIKEVTIGKKEEVNRGILD